MQVSEAIICTSCLVEIAVSVVVFAYFVLAFFMPIQQHDNTTTALK